MLLGHATPALEPFRSFPAPQGDGGGGGEAGVVAPLLLTPDRCCSLVGLDFSLDLVAAHAAERAVLVQVPSQGGGGSFFRSCFMGFPPCLSLPSS